MKKSKFLQKRRYEAFVFLLISGGILWYLGSKMSASNLLSSIMNTAHDLLLNTVFYIMAITVLAGAFGKLMIEFGVVRLLEVILAPLMRPLFNLPGVASIGALMTFFSDNPAIISLAKDKNFRAYFKKYELISLTNFGTAFGMGLIVISFMIGKGFFTSAIIGLAGSIVGSISSTRIMQNLIKKQFHEIPLNNDINKEDDISFSTEGSVFQRFLNAILDGGKSGVDLGLAIIPGVLTISTFIMLITFGPKDSLVGYQGLAYEGVPLLPKIAGILAIPFKYLFGFENPGAIAFPITALGAVGAALSLIPRYLETGIAGANEIAVFTAMGMCWSGYLSTHTAMLDALGYRKLTSKALISHTIGGLVAGICAHYLFLLVKLFQ